MELKLLVDALWAAGKVVSAVCHGPGGLVSAVTPDDKPIVAGRRVTGFSNEEEKMVSLISACESSLQACLVVFAYKFCQLAFDIAGGNEGTRGLVRAVAPTDKPTTAGERVTGFSNEEQKW